MYLVTIAIMVRKMTASCCFECHFKSNVKRKASHKAIHMHLQQQQNCSHKTWHTHIKIVSNGIRQKKVLFLCLGKIN